MNKKLFILFFCFLFFIGISINANAIITDYMMSRYNFTNNALCSDCTGLQSPVDFTCVNTPTYNSSGIRFITASSQYCYNGINKYIVNNGNFTVCTEFYINAAGGFPIVEERTSAGDNFGMLWNFNVNDIYWADGGTDFWAFQQPSLSSFSWIKTCMGYNKTNSEAIIWINGYKNKTKTLTLDINALVDTEIGRMESRAVGYADMYLRNLCIWNKTLTNADVIDYNSSGCAVGGGAPATPSLSLTSDLAASGTYINNPMIFNITGTPTNCYEYPATCRLYLNGTLNMTNENVNVSKTNFTFDTTGWEKGYDINVTCNVTNATSSVVKTNVFWDTVPTNITINSNFVNNSVYYHNRDKVNFSITFADLDLFYVNVSVFSLNTNRARNASLNNTNSSIPVGTLTMQINYSNEKSIDLLSCATCHYMSSYDDAREYEVFGESWESHTGKEIPDFTVEFYQNDALVPDTGSGNFKDANKIRYEKKISISSPNLKWIKTTKKTDKYTQDFSFDILNPIVTIESNSKLYPIDSHYKNHLVDFANKKWIDMNCSDVVSSSLAKVNDTKYTVSFTLKKKDITCESAGNLGYNAKSWYFNITNGMTFYANYTNVSIANFTINLYNGAGSIIQTQDANEYNTTFNYTSGTYDTGITHPDYISNRTNVVYSSNGTMLWKMYQDKDFTYFINGTTQINSTSLLSNFIVLLINQSSRTVMQTTNSSATGTWNFTITGYSAFGNYSVMAYNNTKDNRGAKAEVFINVINWIRTVT